VFAAGRAIEGPVEVSFFAWELDEFGERAMIPFHVRLSLEGIPQHAWSQELADKFMCDEAIVHHVEENTRKKVDFRVFCCWAFSKDMSWIPQVVFLTMSSFEVEAHRDAQVHFVRPRGMKHSHIFKILIHIDVSKTYPSTIFLVKNSWLMERCHGGNSIGIRDVQMVRFMKKSSIQRLGIVAII
jgi:hypothetical protein